MRMSVAGIYVKEMILTHGECERLSIVLGSMEGCTKKKQKAGRIRR